MPKALIIGAGISGLTAAHSLQERGWEVIVLESNQAAGGAIRSHLEDDFLSEAGPNSFMVQTRTQEALIRDLGLADEVVQPSAEARKRYLVRNGRLLAAPSSPWSAVTTPLFSFPAKLRMLREPWVHKPSGLVEESLAAFIRRRVGPEVLDYAMTPFVGGIYAGDPERLSVQEGFPKLARLESEHGSLIRGALAKMKARKKAKSAGEAPFKPYMASFQKGLQTLPDALAARLGDALHLNARLTRLSQDSGWQATWQNDSSQESGGFDHVILAVPAYRLDTLPVDEPVSEVIVPLTDIPHPPVTSLFLGYKREQVWHPLDGFGVLMPEVEKGLVLGALFSSSLFSGRTPEGHVALTVFVGGTRQPELAHEPIETLLPKVQEELEWLLGVKGDPVVVRPSYWPKAIPQYIMGYARYREQMEEAERKYPGLHLIGNYRGGIALGQCLDNALDLAEKLCRV